jgi:hypothetical protein
MAAAAKTFNVNAGREALKDLAKRYCSSSRQDDALAVVRRELRQGVDRLVAGYCSIVAYFGRN